MPNRYRWLAVALNLAVTVGFVYLAFGRLDFGQFVAVLSRTNGLFGGWFAMSTATLGTMLPSTPGYVGTFDYFAMVGLEAFGAGKESAAAFSLVVHLLLWIGLTSVGGACLWFHWGRSWSRGLIWRSDRPIE
jgi:uncharacterized membrane protein YbhN (UPF0104 family)